MDSKLQRNALIISICMIVGICGLVYFTNGKKKENYVEDNIVEDTQRYSEENVTFGQIGDDLYAYLKDETFFDPEQNTFIENLLNEKMKLNLSVCSVERDLRICISNYNGDIVTGEEFVVTIEDLGEFKDLEKDGILYIGDIEAGEYLVSLNPIGEYQIPADAIRVRVKERLEFLPIEDIRFHITKEKEIQKDKELSSFSAALEEEEGRTQVEIKGNENYEIGIDISSEISEVDWNKVKEDGISFALVKVGYRGMKSGDLIEDPNFDEHMREAFLSGISLGAVFSSQAINEKEAVEEASMVLELIQGKHISYPILLDIQGAGGEGRGDDLSILKRTEIALAFCKTIENAGYKAGIYASKGQLEKQINAGAFEDYCIWLAEYKEVPEYEGYYQMWQYTPRGKINGIKEPVHMSVSYMNMD